MNPILTEAQIELIGRGLLERSLPKSQWTHVAHFAAAFWLLGRSGLQAVVGEMPALIRAYNEATGVKNTDFGGYHATITIGSLRVADWWLRGHRELPLHEALAGLLTAKYGRSDWLLDHWSESLLFSVAARRGWVEPDLRLLPCAPMDSG